MNIIQQAETLKDLSDQQIAKEMQHPSGSVPLYLVSSEAKRRADLRDRFKAEASGPPPTSTVQEDLLRSVLSNEMAPTGIVQNIPQSPPTQAARSAPQMPVQTPPQQQGIMQGAPSPQGLPGNSGAPRGFADGGIVYNSPRISVQEDFRRAPGVMSQFATDVKSGLKSGLQGSHDFFFKPGETLLDRERAALDAQTARTAARKAESLRRKIGNTDNAGYLTEEEAVAAERDRAYTQRGFVSEPTNVPPGALDGMWPNDTQLNANNMTASQLAAVSGGYTPAATSTGITSGAPAAQTPLQQALDAQKVFATKGGIMGGIGGGDGFKTAAMPNALTLSKDFDFKQSQADKLAELNKQSDPYADQAARLTAREEDIAGDAETNKWLALARAGFGAAGGTSPYAMSNIAEGAMAGLDDYAAGRKDITAREDKAFDARTAMIGLQEDLKAKRTEESYKFAQGMQSAQETNNNIKIAEHNASLKATEIQNQAAYQSATLAQKESQFGRTLQAGVLEGAVDRAAKSEENALTRKSNETIAKLPPKDLQMVHEWVKLSKSDNPDDKKAADLIERSMDTTLNKALVVQDEKWSQAMTLASKEITMPEPNEKKYEAAMVAYRQSVLQKFAALGGNDALGQSYALTRLGGGVRGNIGPTKPPKGKGLQGDTYVR